MHFQVQALSLFLATLVTSGLSIPIQVQNPSTDVLSRRDIDALLRREPQSSIPPGPGRSWINYNPPMKIEPSIPIYQPGPPIFTPPSPPMPPVIPGVTVPWPGMPSRRPLGDKTVIPDRTPDATPPRPSSPELQQLQEAPEKVGGRPPTGSRSKGRSKGLSKGLPPNLKKAPRPRGPVKSGRSGGQQKARTAPSPGGRRGKQGPARRPRSPPAGVRKNLPRQPQRRK